MSKTRGSFRDIEEIQRNYVITEDGMVYSKIRGRWLKPRLNTSGYVFYTIVYKDHPYREIIHVFAHTLVALVYVGVPPSDNHEIDHIDENKTNNHWSNLMWRTHADNVRASYDRGRRGWWLGRNRPSPVLETRMKMADAKKKRVCYTVGGDVVIYESIGEAATALGTYRKRVSLCIKENLPFKGGILSVQEDSLVA